MSSKELHDWGLKKKIYLYGGASSFALEEVRLTHNADRCTLHTRGERGGPKSKLKILSKFLLSCLKIGKLLHLTIFSPWGSPPGSPPHRPYLPVGEDHTLHPSTGLRGSSGGSSPARPPPQLCLPGPCGPGDARMLGSVGLWLGAGDFGTITATSYCRQLLVSVCSCPGTHTLSMHTGTYLYRGVSRCYHGPFKS